MTRFQGRGSFRRPNCPQCGDSQIMVSAYIKTGNWYEGKQRWVKIGYYCKLCHYFQPVETEFDIQRQQLLEKLESLG